MGEESIDERMPPNNTTVDEHVRDWVKRREGETKTLRSWTKIGNSTLQGVKDNGEDAEPDASAGVSQQPRESRESDGQTVLEAILRDLVQLGAPLIQRGEAVGGRRRLFVPRAFRCSLLDTGGVGISALVLLKALEVWLFIKCR